MSRIEYTQNDLDQMNLEEDDISKPDKATDIKPVFSSASTKGFQVSSSSGVQNGPVLEYAPEEEDEEDEDFDSSEEVSEWSVRKSAAAAIDLLAIHFKNDILQYILPVINQRYFSPLLFIYLLRYSFILH